MDVLIQTVTLELEINLKELRHFMTIHGLWALEWGTNLGLTQAGTIKFESGIISGGDSNHNYSGKYQTHSANCLKGTLEIVNIKSEPITIFGKNSTYIINFTGDFGIAEANPHRRALMVIDSQLNTGPDQLIRLICEK
ncbi:MAG: hypothetical protein OEZ51_02970 [Nitrospinota bacterium]|nr:hypothetical protein [Nitrospinota bacterium]